uniref:Uncharacterized protein n=1 Tax=Falco tinnunculus TaxID=100819 RepID=A0A8C4UBU7_FALTI
MLSDSPATRASLLREVQEEEAFFSDPGRTDQRKKPEYSALECFMTVENTATKVPLSILKIRGAECWFPSESERRVPSTEALTSPPAHTGFSQKPLSSVRS